MTTTALGSAVRATVDGGQKSPMIGKKEHSTNNSLRDVILGGQDGLVNMLGIALGVVAAGGSTHVLVVTGIAAAITESISMGAVAYTSFGTDRDFYLAEMVREENDVEANPEAERDEIREIYAAKGFQGQLLEDVVSIITANRKTWVSTMMNEELHLQPVEQQSLVRSAVICHSGDTHRSLHSNCSIHGRRTDPGYYPGDSTQCSDTLRCGSLFREDSGWRLAQERDTNGSDRSRRSGAGILDRPLVPHDGELN